MFLMMKVMVILALLFQLPLIDQAVKSLAHFTKILIFIMIVTANLLMNQPVQPKIQPSTIQLHKALLFTSH